MLAKMQCMKRKFLLLAAIVAIIQGTVVLCAGIYLMFDNKFLNGLAAVLGGVPLLLGQSIVFIYVRDQLRHDEVPVPNEISSVGSIPNSEG